MNFIAIMIALGVETFYKPISQWRNYQWFSVYEKWLLARLEKFSFRNGPIGVIIVFIPVFAVIAILAVALYDFFALLGFLLAALVLIYTLGPEDLDDEVQAFLHAHERDDEEGASHHADKIIGYRYSGKPEEVFARVKEAIFIEGNTRMLGVLFWFVLLGPAGALLYRLSDRQNRHYREEQTGYADSAKRLFDILSWLPARLCVLGFAVMGNFVDTMSKWNSVNDFWVEDNETLLTRSGAGALQQDHSEEHPVSMSSSEIFEALALVKRTIVFWVAVIAVLTLTGTFF